MDPRAAWPDFSQFGPHPAAPVLRAWLTDARARTRAWLGDLDADARVGPQAALLNPPLWEVGHLAWFWEKWLLREGDTTRLPSGLVARTDRLYDSAAVAHDTRWRLPLLSWDATWRYLDEVLARVDARLAHATLGDELAYFTQLCIFHHDMHNEAFAIRRQALGDLPLAAGGAALPGAVSLSPATAKRTDIEIPAGMVRQGARAGGGFVFDNEKWAHEVTHDAFAIASHPVTQGEFRAFVEAGGYARRAWWSEDGWRWRESAGATHPACWRQAGGQWQARRFDAWQPCQADVPVVHVNAHEAEAWCRWAERRLPSETEWERAHDALQERGQGWEWTATSFAPYPGFSADPYAEYSMPWFDGRFRVLRGGSVATAPRCIWRTWRNFYTPERSDMFCGFRTCRLAAD